MRRAGSSRYLGHGKWSGAAVTAAGTVVVAPLQGLTIGAPAVVACVVAAAGWSIRRSVPVVAALVAVAGYLVAVQPFGPIQLVVGMTLYTLGRIRPVAVTAAVSAVAAAVLIGALWARVDTSHVEIESVARARHRAAV